MRVIDEQFARFYFPVSVLFIRGEGIEWIIDRSAFLIDVETFIAEASRFGWDLGHVAPAELGEKPRSLVGEFVRRMKQKAV